MERGVNMAEVDGLDKKQTEQLQVSIGFEQRYPDEDFTPATILYGVLPRSAIATPFMSREASFWMFRNALTRQLVRSGGGLMEEVAFNEAEGTLKVRLACDSIIACQMAAESFLREAGGEKTEISVWMADTGTIKLPGARTWPSDLTELKISVYLDGSNSQGTGMTYSAHEAQQICSKLPSWTGHGSGDVLEALAEFVAAKLFSPKTLGSTEFEIERAGSVATIRFINTEGCRHRPALVNLRKELMELPLSR